MVSATRALEQQCKSRPEDGRAEESTKRGGGGLTIFGIYPISVWIKGQLSGVLPETLVIPGMHEIFYAETMVSTDPFARMLKG